MIIDEIIQREGGFVNHSADKGGPTKYGITQATLSEWRGEPVDIREVERLSIAEAKDIYHEKYVKKPGFDGIQNNILRELVVDFGVHSGPLTAGKYLQQAVNQIYAPRIAVDGQIGPRTLAAVNASPWASVAIRLMGLRISKLGRIITHNPEQAAFAAGWMNRCHELLKLVAQNLAV